MQRGRYPGSKSPFLPRAKKPLGNQIEQKLDWSSRLEDDLETAAKVPAVALFIFNSLSSVFLLSA